jgi:hypothetical protein
VRVDGALAKAGVGGDPDMVSAAATRFGQTAELTASAAEGLHQLDAEAAQSDAIAAFLAKAGEIEAQLRKVHERYVGAAEALRTYSEALRRAQEQAGPAVREHEAATADRDAATTLAGRYEGMALLATSEEAQLDYQELARGQRLREEEARGRVTDLEAAATAAIARFDDLSADGLGDSWWDDVRGAAGTAYDAFRTWMEENDWWIQDVLEILSWVGVLLVVAALAFPGTAWIAWPAMAAMILSTTTEAARAAAGTRSLLELGISVVSLATFGVGGAVLKTAAKTSVAKLGLARVAELQRGGVPLQTALKAVNGEHQAVMKAPLSLAAKIRALGDPELGRLFTWSRESGAALTHTGSRAMTELDLLLNATTTVRASSLVVTTARAADTATGWAEPLLGDLREATTLRLVNGTPW